MTDRDTILAHAVALTVAVIRSERTLNEKPIADILDRMYEVVQERSQDGLKDPAILGGRQLTEDEIKASLTIDHLISFEDGKPYKSLKKHIAKYGLTPDQYRAKWGLPAKYPMASVRYSETRSALAKASGLGKSARKSGR